jgi:hypothetical protein
LPFAYDLYDQTFTSVDVSSNGNLQFGSSDTEFQNGCLPDGTFTDAIMPYWDDLRTDLPGGGVFTSVSGIAPNRIFNIEWRAALLFSATNDMNFEVRLYEGQTKFDIVYGSLADDGSGATIGVQRDTGSQDTEFSCNTSSVAQGLQLTFTRTPSAVTIATLEARAAGGGVLVRWRTASEAGLAGFNIWRSTGKASPRRVNPGLIRAHGSASGASYSFLDRSTHGAGATYRLQLVHLNGTRTWGGSVTARR